MSKRALKTYIKGLSKKQLEVQIIDLYERFKEVEAYYNFVFNPREDKLIREAQAKIHKEYFPNSGRKAKTRRSVAQKLIKHYNKLGMEPTLVLDLMLYNLETAQRYSELKPNMKAGFNKSMLKSFQEAVNFGIYHRLISENKERILKIAETTELQKWENAMEFRKIVQSVLN